MELEIGEKSLNRENIKDKQSEEMEKFIDELQKFIEEKNPLRKEKVLSNQIGVVKDRTDERVTIVDIENGNEFDIFIAKSEDDIKRLNNNNIFKNIYGVSEETFYNIDLGSNISLNKGKCQIYNQEVTIENSKAIQKLEELYFNLKEEEGHVYTVDRITDEKIYLKGNEGGYFSIYQKAYPNFEVGNTVKKENGKYVLKKSY